MRARDGGGRTVRVVGNAGGGGNRRGGGRTRRATWRGGGRTRRATVGEADRWGAGDNNIIEIIRVDVWPLGSIVHSRQGGQFAGRRLVCSSVLHVDLTMRESF